MQLTGKEFQSVILRVSCSQVHLGQQLPSRHHLAFRKFCDLAKDLCRTGALSERIVFGPPQVQSGPDHPRILHRLSVTSFNLKITDIR